MGCKYVLANKFQQQKLFEFYSRKVQTHSDDSNIRRLLAENRPKTHGKLISKNLKILEDLPITGRTVPRPLKRAYPA